MTVGLLTTRSDTPAEIAIAWESFLLFAVATMAYGVVFTAFAVGLSAAMPPRAGRWQRRSGAPLSPRSGDLGAGLGNLLSDHANIGR